MREYVDDRAAICDLIYRYAVACDRRDFAAIAACFTVDAQAEYSGVQLRRGVKHIVEHLQPLTRLAATQHIVGTILIEVTGDVASATSYAVANLVRVVDSGHQLVRRGLSYTDRLIHTDTGWLITDRIHRVTWASKEETLWPVEPYTV